MDADIGTRHAGQKKIKDDLILKEPETHQGINPNAPLVISLVSQ